MFSITIWIKYINLYQKNYFHRLTNVEIALYYTGLQSFYVFCIYKNQFLQS